MKQRIVRAVDTQLLVWMLLRPMKARTLTPLMTAALLASVPTLIRSEVTSDVKAPAAEPKEETAQPQKMMPEVPSDVAAAPADAEKTASGLASKVLNAGTGDKKPAAADTVTVHYTGWTTDGKQFDSSVERGEPTSFPLNGVIKGWTEGLQLMVEGEKRRFWIPEELAYGPKVEGSPRPGGMLCFDVELLGIKAAPEAAKPPEGTEKTASGVAYKLVKKGEGQQPGAGNIVTFHFTGKTMEGQIVQDSRSQPAPPSVQLDQLPPEMAELLGEMTAGEQRTCWLPEAKIPGGFIVADIELVSFKDAPPIAKVPEDTEKSASGIAYKQVKKGEGDKPGATDVVTFHFTAKSMQGEVLQDSRTQPEPPSMPLDKLSPELAGIISEMNAGEQRTCWLPEAKIPGGFIAADIELISFKPQAPAPAVPEDVTAAPADAEKTESGLASKLLKAGEGKVKPKASDTVKVHYTGWETDGKMFDSSVTRGEPAQFPLGGVIPGWTEGLQLMVVGEKRRFWIPEGLAYGPKQEGGGRPGGMLCFEVELLEIVATEAK